MVISNGNINNKSNQFNYFLRAGLVASSHLFSNIHSFKYTVTMISDCISFLEINALRNEVFLAINKFQYLWRQRAD